VRIAVILRQRLTIARRVRSLSRDIGRKRMSFPRVTRRDEQILGLLVRVQMSEDTPELARSEWQRMLKGVVNNQPEYLVEWHAGASRIKRALRETFGPNDGDARRQRGWGALNIGGPITRGAINRFSTKLGQALYYQHIGRIFEGDIYVAHIDPLNIRRNPQHFQEVLRLTPLLATSQRSKKDLAEQFIYRYNHSVEMGALNAIIRIGDQFLFHILVISKETVQRMSDEGEPPPIRSSSPFHRTIRRRATPRQD
jgi:hypothetical protein